MTRLKLVWETQTGGRAGIVPRWGRNIGSSFLNPPRPRGRRFPSSNNEKTTAKTPQNPKFCPVPAPEEMNLSQDKFLCSKVGFLLFFQGNIFRQRTFLTCNEICKSGCTGRNCLMISSAFYREKKSKPLDFPEIFFFPWKEELMWNEISFAAPT